MLEDVESGALTHFFQIPAILPSQVPNTLKEFDADVATKDLAFVRKLFATDIRGLFVDACRTIFRVEPLVLMVSSG